MDLACASTHATHLDLLIVADWELCPKYIHHNSTSLPVSRIYFAALTQRAAAGIHWPTKRS